MKIDRSFISNLPNKEDKIIVKAIIAIASGFNMTVTAEGVETDDQDNVIKQIGCDKAQGYLMSKALPADEFELKYLSKK